MEFLYRVLAYVDVIFLLITAFLFVLFLLFCTFGIWFKRKFLKIFFLLLALVCLLIIPLAVAYASRDIFYKVDVVRDNSRPMVYSPSFIIDLLIKNDGRVSFQRCVVSVSSVSLVEDFKSKLQNLFSIPSVRFTFYKNIGVGGMASLFAVVPYNQRNSNYKLRVECR